jgi:hypothetical protein
MISAFKADDNSLAGDIRLQIVAENFPEKLNVATCEKACSKPEEFFDVRASSVGRKSN